MSFFDLAASTGEGKKGGAIEGTHYKVLRNKAGKTWRVINFDNPEICRRSGLVELVPNKVSRRHENSLRTAKIYDKDNDIWIGMPKGFNSDTDELEFEMIVVQDSETFDLSNTKDAMKWTVIKNHYDVAGSPFCKSPRNAKYKIFDADRDAEIFLAKRTIKRKAENLAEAMVAEPAQLKDFAILLFGGRARSMSIPQMAQQVIMSAEKEPEKWMDFYDSPNRYETTVVKKAIALGVLVKDERKGVCYQGLPMGNTEASAVQYLKDNITLLAVIEELIAKVDADSAKSMAKKGLVKQQPTSSAEAENIRLKQEIEELKKANAEISTTKLEAHSLDTEIGSETDDERKKLLQIIKDKGLGAKIRGAHRYSDVAALKAKVDEELSKINN